ncbi:hypothetical protein NDU88_007065 [Pleurodeles waltl]|uniref:Uncharacterized protein n=1 Tax=Pleurodeles waltl TaxID=8319 RepID=A0AAV7U035_PLEWA|nr:hypothetical protein NDU88_007065 [Pleurodeles waltl]
MGLCYAPVISKDTFKVCRMWLYGVTSCYVIRAKMRVGELRAHFYRLQKCLEQDKRRDLETGALRKRAHEPAGARVSFRKRLLHDGTHRPFVVDLFSDD